MTSPHEAATAAPTRAEKPRRLHIPGAAAENSRVRAATASKDALAPSHEAAKASIETDMRSQTCVEFLHIMKEFSESSCDANEMVQRVDSLVSQDEQLLRLFPLSRQQGEDEAARRLRRALEDEDDASVERITARDNDKEMENQDELQRWMDLDLGDLDHHHMDVFDFQHSQPLELNEVMDAAAATQVVPPTASPFMKKGTNGFLTQKTNQTAATEAANTATSYLRGQSASQKPLSAAAKNICSPLSKKSVTAALFADDDEDDLDLVLGGAALTVGPPLKRAKLSRPNNTHELQVSVQKAETDNETTKSDEDEEGNVWGMENDGYEHDLLSSIDHAVLCDRENRFLQWDVEVAAQQQQQQQQQEQQRRMLVNSLSRNVATPANITAARNGRVGNGVNSSTNSAVNGIPGNLTAIQTHSSQLHHDKMVMASSPRSSKSPSNVDIVEDWNSLDFGTFQNRTVSHILSSCLHKRKLHHPYKNQVQLVNFSVPGGGPDSDGASGHGTGQHSHQLGGSLATSLAFGGQQNGTLNGTDGLNGFVPLLATGHENSLGGSSKSPGKSEKRTPKKREERKRLMTLKMQETFADLEGTFTEQDLDVKGIVGPGASLSKMALSKLENLPLPDLTNLPADLRELKRKIEATEHKVEGTKHRHRKGGPCPRCQVQNQLRAAKRAYHKRAVAHKKLPHVVVNAVNDEAQEAANAQAAAAATLELAGSVTLAMKAAASAASRKANGAPSAAANHIASAKNASTSGSSTGKTGKEGRVGGNATGFL
ncbi:hypothetical protein BBJ29_004481 [Phytophthora kernoviae]|uniref:Uncharacterized protein n=1 Tax=Phytophthora kernoviae TaxID=325452 RepID=A0A3F2RJI5_9STRA|nr:hypothetical protein BBP00_00006957 [Phytophthora kernoviae]RLN70427.1 hypothetical protein BBJ29_004481 [Phytophthora kernoviae]